MTERTTGTFMRMLRIRKKTVFRVDWDLLLPIMVFAYNSTRTKPSGKKSVLFTAWVSPKLHLKWNSEGKGYIIRWASASGACLAAYRADVEQWLRGMPARLRVGVLEATVTPQLVTGINSRGQRSRGIFFVVIFLKLPGIILLSFQYNPSFVCLVLNEPY